MDPVYLTALAAIAGVLLGSLGTGFVDWLAERRRERAQARVAAGFIRSELNRNWLVLQAARKTKVWWTPEGTLSFSAWEKWGPALLTGAPEASAKSLHAAVLALDVLDQNARERWQGVETASDGQVGEGGTETVGDVALTDSDDEQLQAVARTIQAASADVPRERLPPWARRALPVVTVVGIALLTAISIGLYARAVDAASVSADEVAEAVQLARGAEMASCSVVKDVHDDFTCRLTYVADPATCPLTRQHAQASSRIQLASNRLLAVTSRPCDVQATTIDQVVVDPRRAFRDTLAKMAVEATAPEAKRTWKDRLPRVLIGKVD